MNVFNPPALRMKILKPNLKRRYIMKYMMKDIHQSFWIPLKTCITRIIRKRDDDDPFNHPYAIL